MYDIDGFDASASDVAAMHAAGIKEHYSKPWFSRKSHT
jgi:hypothetical protein